MSYQTAEHPNETVADTKRGCGANATFDTAVGSAHQCNTQENMLYQHIIKLMHLFILGPGNSDPRNICLFPKCFHIYTTILVKKVDAGIFSIITKNLETIRTSVSNTREKQSAVVMMEIHIEQWESRGSYTEQLWVNPKDVLLNKTQAKENAY